MTRHRVRGLAPYRPQAKAAALIDDVNAVLLEYRDHLPLTLRQVFYRLVGTVGYAKTESAYDALLETVNRARRAGMVPWEAIRDDGIHLDLNDGFDSAEDWLAGLSVAARQYRRDRHACQPQRVEVWVEAGGMVPQVNRVAAPYGVPVMSCGGFDSTTAKHETARRIVEDGRPCTVLHVGDHDPSGVAIMNAAFEDVNAFVRSYEHSGIHIIRAAVTPEQAERHGLPGAPPKDTDRRGSFSGLTYQAEALAPADLADYLRAAMEAELDLDLHAAVLHEEAAERHDLLTLTEGLRL